MMDLEERDTLNRIFETGLYFRFCRKSNITIGHQINQKLKKTPTHGN